MKVEFVVVRDNLTLAAFREFPVWTVDDDQERYLSCDVPGYLPEDISPLFVECEVTTAAGRTLPGYAVVSAGVYAVGVLAEDAEFVFNVSPPDLVPGAAAGVRAAYDLPEGERIVPLRYACRLGFRGQPPISGTLSPA